MFRFWLSKVEARGRSEDLHGHGGRDVRGGVCSGWCRAQVYGKQESRLGMVIMKRMLVAIEQAFCMCDLEP